MARRRRKREIQAVVPTASMGDIAFLLIIFFIVCSSFTQNASHSIELAASTELDKVEESQITVTVDQEGKIFCQKDEIVDPKALEEALKVLLEDKKGPKERTVMFRCDRSMTRKQFEPVIGAISKAGGMIAAVGEKKDETKADQ